MVDKREIDDYAEIVLPSDYFEDAIMEEIFVDIMADIGEVYVISPEEVKEGLEYCYECDDSGIQKL